MSLESGAPCVAVPRIAGSMDLLVADRSRRATVLWLHAEGVCRSLRHEDLRPSTWPKPSSRSRRSFKSVRHTVSRRRAARFSRATSTPRFALRNRLQRKRQNGLSSRRANSPGKPSSPKAIRKASFRKVCSNPACSIHHPVSRPAATMENGRQSKSGARKKPSNTTRIRVLSAIGAAVPVRPETRPAIPPHSNCSPVRRVAASDFGAATRRTEKP